MSSSVWRQVTGTVSLRDSFLPNPNLRGFSKRSANLEATGAPTRKIFEALEVVSVSPYFAGPDWLMIPLPSSTLMN